jgi:hypothetical protein
MVAARMLASLSAGRRVKARAARTDTEAMAAPRNEDTGEQGADEAPAPPPWWTSGRLRLCLLLACLGVSIVALLSNVRVFSSSTGDAIASGQLCMPATPPLTEASVSQLKELHAGLLEMMAPLARARYAWGTVTPAEAWSDEQPSGLRSAVHSGRPAKWLWPASFEMRSWTVDPQLTSALEDVGADVFMFANSAQARSFFMEASNARCHRDGVEGSAPQPPEAHTLAWVNPDAAAEEDVFLLRGPRVYRVAVVRPQGRTPSASQRQAGLARAATLACAFPSAGCEHSGVAQHQPARRPPGDRG